MTIKTLTVAAATLAALAGRADAQVIYSGGTFATPGVVYSSGTPGVVYSSYSTPVYGTRALGTGAILPGGYVYPSYTTGYYGGHYGNQIIGNPYTTGYFGPNSGLYTPYSNAFYSGYNNLYNAGVGGLGVGTRGASFGGRRLIRW